VPRVCLSSSRLLFAVSLPALAAGAAHAANDVDARWQPALEHRQQGSDAIAIDTVSTRNDMISGGDVLVRIRASGGDPGYAGIRVGDRDISEDFRPDGDGLIGLVTGLEPGDSELVVALGDGSEASLVLTSHPITGPLFAGPQQQPFLCETESFAGLDLGAPLDEDCSIETRVDYFYRADGAFKPLSDISALPDDVETTSLRGGGEVPYVVRVETGTIGRSIYNIAILHDPTSDPEPSPFGEEPGWNGKLVYYFGGGCIRGYYRQGEGDLADVLVDG
jgi:hypothetical protein